MPPTAFRRASGSDWLRDALPKLVLSPNASSRRKLCRIACAAGHRKKIAVTASWGASSSHGSSRLPNSARFIRRELSGKEGAGARCAGREQGEVITDPMRLIVPMLERFIATDRGFAKARRATTQETDD